MRIFNHFNTEAKDPCPVCNTKEDKKTTLISIYGTNEDGGRTYQAKQVHVDCIDLTLYPSPTGEPYLYLGQKILKKNGEKE